MNPLVPYRPLRPPSDLDAAFADFLRVDVASGDASDDTIRSYRSEVEMWVTWCIERGLDPAKVTVADITLYRQALIENNYSPVTVKWKLSILRRFYDAACNAGLRPDNPAAGVKAPRQRQATEDFKYLCDEELAKLFAAIPSPDDAIGPEKVRRLRNLLMVSMMALQALRTVEVHRANVDDVLEKGEHLTLLVRGKTRDRIVYLRPDTAKRMREYLALRGTTPGTPLFMTVGYHGGEFRVSRRTIRIYTDRFLEVAGLKRPGISNHALRHTAATLGYLHTGDLRAVQEFLGHADPRMTSRYAHVVDMAKRNPALFIPAKLTADT